MTNQEAKKYTNEIFNRIRISTTIDELKRIPDCFEIPIKNQMDNTSYPTLELRLTKDEIEKLIDQEILGKDLEFNNNISAKMTDPLTKLLYALSWKNGDLKKIKHIAKGILEGDKNQITQDEALVFYQFGKYLTKIPGQPIIDQHVIRAFGIHNTSDDTEINALRQLQVLNKKHKQLIIDYINWLSSDNINFKLRANEGYSYHIDKVLFAVGKTIKQKNGKP